MIHVLEGEAVVVLALAASALTLAIIGMLFGWDK